MPLARSRAVAWRRHRSAGVGDPAADPLIDFRESAGAVDEPVAPLDDEVRIDADHQQAPRLHPRQHVAVVVRSLAIVVEKAGADHRCSRLNPAEPDGQAFEDRPVVVGAEVVDAALREGRNQVAGHVARRDNGIVGVTRHTKTLEHSLDV